MDKQTLSELVASEEITITDVIDVVIELNHIIGVGLISLGEQLKTYTTSKI